MQSNKSRKQSKNPAIKPNTNKVEFVEKKVGYYQKDDSVTTLYIGNLKYSKDEFQIKEMLEKFGKVKYVKIVVDPKTNNSKGIAFAQMPNGKHAKAAIEALNGSQLDGRTLKVSIAKARGTSNSVAKEQVAMITDKSPEVFEETKTRGRTSRRKERGLNQLFDYLQKK